MSNEEKTGQGGPPAVPFINLRSSVRLAMAAVFLAGLAASTRADAIPGYSITFLGPGNPAFSADANGNGIVIAPNGQTAYPFQLSPPVTSLNAQQLQAMNFPIPIGQTFTDIPPYDLTPYSHISYLNPVTSGDGLVVYQEAWGIYQHQGETGEYYIQQNPDGTWGSPISISWAGGYVSAEGVQPPPTITGINHLGEVLGLGLGPGSSSWYDTLLYNTHTNQLTDLTTLLPQSSTWLDPQPVAIDQQGRILLQASGFGQGEPYGLLLLTPDGVSSDPLPVPAPEPGSLAVTALTLAALALRLALPGTGHNQRRRVSEPARESDYGLRSAECRSTNS